MPPYQDSLYRSAWMPTFTPFRRACSATGWPSPSTATCVAQSGTSTVIVSVMRFTDRLHANNRVVPTGYPPAAHPKR